MQFSLTQQNYLYRVRNNKATVYFGRVEDVVLGQRLVQRSGRGHSSVTSNNPGLDFRGGQLEVCEFAHTVHMLFDLIYFAQCRNAL